MKKTTKAQRTATGSTLLALWLLLKDGWLYMTGLGWNLSLIDPVLARGWLVEILALAALLWPGLALFEWVRGRLTGRGVQRKVASGSVEIDADSDDFIDTLPDLGSEKKSQIIADGPAVIDMDKFYSDLKRDEGIKNVTYLDSLGKLTAGIGHLVLPHEPEYSIPVGSKIGIERVREWFVQDTKTALRDVVKLFPDYNTYPMEARLVLANMCFQLGYPGFSKFKRTRMHIADRDWKSAADEMLDSRWAQQTPGRARRHANRLKDIEEIADQTLALGWK